MAALWEEILNFQGSNIGHFGGLSGPGGPGDPSIGGGGRSPHTFSKGLRGFRDRPDPKNGRLPILCKKHIIAIQSGATFARGPGSQVLPGPRQTHSPGYDPGPGLTRVVRRPGTRPDPGRRCALLALICVIGVVWAGPGPPVSGQTGAQAANGVSHRSYRPPSSTTPRPLPP